jgi:hypothetical protein
MKQQATRKPGPKYPPAPSDTVPARLPSGQALAVEPGEMIMNNEAVDAHEPQLRKMNQDGLKHRAKHGKSKRSEKIAKGAMGRPEGMCNGGMGYADGGTVLNALGRFTHGLIGPSATEQDTQARLNEIRSGAPMAAPPVAAPAMGAPPVASPAPSMPDLSGAMGALRNRQRVIDGAVGYADGTDGPLNWDNLNRHRDQRPVGERFMTGAQRLSDATGLPDLNRSSADMAGRIGNAYGEGGLLGAGGQLIRESASGWQGMGSGLMSHVAAPAATVLAGPSAGASMRQLMSDNAPPTLTAPSMKPSGARTPSSEPQAGALTAGETPAAKAVEGWQISHDIPGQSIAGRAPNGGTFTIARGTSPPPGFDNAYEWVDSPARPVSGTALTVSNPAIGYNPALAMPPGRARRRVDDGGVPGGAEAGMRRIQEGFATGRVQRGVPVIDGSEGRAMGEKPYGNPEAHRAGMAVLRSGGSYESGYNRVAGNVLDLPEGTGIALPNVPAPQYVTPDTKTWDERLKTLGDPTTRRGQREQAALLTGRQNAINQANETNAAAYGHQVSGTAALQRAALDALQGAASNRLAEARLGLDLRKEDREARMGGGKARLEALQWNLAERIMNGTPEEREAAQKQWDTLFRKGGGSTGRPQLVNFATNDMGGTRPAMWVPGETEAVPIDLRQDPATPPGWVRLPGRSETGKPLYKDEKGVVHEYTR